MGAVAMGLLLGYFAAVVTSSAYQAIAGKGANDLGLAVSGMMGLWVGFAGLPIALSWTRGSRSLALDFGFRFDLRKDLPMGLVLGLVGQYVLVNVIYQPLRLVSHHWYTKVSDPAERLTGLGHGPGIVLLALTVCVGAPICEELFFRGLTYTTLARRSRPVVAIVGSGALFALMHLQPLQFPALLAFGCLLGYFRARVGRLGPTIIGHMVFNGAALLALLA